MKLAEIKGYSLAAIAAAAYGTNPAFAVPLYAQGMNPCSVLLFRYLMGIPLLALLLIFSQAVEGGVGTRIYPRNTYGVIVAHVVRELRIYEFGYSVDTFIRISCHGCRAHDIFLS